MADRIGLYNPLDGTFFLNYDLAAGPADASFRFGTGGLGYSAVIGDWDGDGISGAGFYNPETGTFFLNDSLAGGAATSTFRFGPAASGWQPLAGNWDGAGAEGVGLYDPISGTFYLKDGLSSGAADHTFRFGAADGGYVAVTGDWDGDGDVTVGLYDTVSGTFFLRDENSAGAATTTFRFGPQGSGWAPVVGDWDGNGTDTVGLYNAAAGTYYLTDINAAGAASMKFGFGPQAMIGSFWQPIAGTWQSGPTPGDTYTLTNGTDIATANIFEAPQVYTPGGNDRVNSLQDEDVLTGTGDNPTLNATLGNPNDNGDTIITPTLNGIQTINAVFSSSADFMELDLQDATGVAAVNVSRVSNDLGGAVSNLASVPAALSLSNTNSPTGEFYFTFLDSAAKGTEDETTLTLSNAVVGNLIVEEDADVLAPDQGVETLNLVSTGEPNIINATIGLVGGAARGLVAEDLVTLNISGDADLTINSMDNVAGSLTTINAGALEGDLTINVIDATRGAVLGATPDGMSGTTVGFSLISGAGDDSLRLNEQVNANDSVDAGEGTDTLRLQSNNNVALDTIAEGAVRVLGVEAVQLWHTGATAAATVMALRSAQVDGDQTLELRNNTNTAAETTTYNVVDLSAVEAAQISIMHSGNSTANPAAASNGLLNNVVDLDVADGVTAVTMTIGEGVNTDPRFNFQLYTDSDRKLNVSADTSAYDVATPRNQVSATAANAVTSLNLADSDTESNTVQLIAAGYDTTQNNALQGNGTAYTAINITGGRAGTFLNLDATANLYQYDTTGGNTDGLAGAGGRVLGVVDPGLGAAERLAAASINASASESDIVVRVGSNFRDTSGGQTIAMGTGNDTVIFDQLNDSRAGLTISDRVSGNTGNDTLVIDGHGVAVTLGASEWTNVSSFETIRLIGNGMGSNNGPGAVNAYNLTLTDAMVTANGAGGIQLAIINDNDPANETNLAQDTAGTAVESGVTIDARGLSAGRSFSYNGEDGVSATWDRFIMTDAIMNGTAVIDGGDWLAGVAQNDDVVEVRNSAVVTVGDLANIRNIGALEFRSDQSVAQTYTLELNNGALDVMDTSQAASTANPERFTMRVVPNQETQSSADVLNLDASTVTEAFDLFLGGARGVNTINVGTNPGANNFGGDDTLVLWGGFAAGTYVGWDMSGRDLTLDSDFNGATAGAGTRAVADVINLGTGADTLVTYGSINLALATLNGIETLEVHSDVTMNGAQFENFGRVTFVDDGRATQVLRINDAGAISVDEIVDAINNAGGRAPSVIQLNGGVLQLSQAQLTTLIDNGLQAIVGTGTIQEVNNGALTFTAAVGIQNTVTAAAGGTTLTGQAALTANPLTGDTTAPVLQTAVVNTLAGATTSTVVLTYGETLSNSSWPELGQYTVKVGGVETAITGVAVAGNTVTLTLDALVGLGATVSLDYRVPAGGAVEDLAGNDALALTNQAVTNGTPETVAPVFASATVNGNTLVMTYTDANNLDAVNVAPTGAFAVTASGTADAVTNVAVNATAKTVTLTLATAVTAGQAVTVAYTDPTAGNDVNAIQDVWGNDAATLAATAVSNQTGGGGGAINVTAGGTFAATAGADIFVVEYTITGGRATTMAGAGEATITGFNAAQDILRFDNTTTTTASTEAAFLATAGVIAADNPFALPAPGSTFFAFDPNVAGVVGSVTLTGIVDAGLTQIVAEIV